MFKQKKRSWFRVGCLSLLILLLAFGSVIQGAPPHYVPFDHESAVAILKKTVETKMVPLEIKNDGLVLTVTKLSFFEMDWEQAQFVLKCSFDAEYKKFGNFRESGDIVFKGEGLIAPEQQKMGLRILNISELKLKGMLSQLSSGIRMVAEKSWAGKELWNGEVAPQSYEKLNKDNFDKLVEVAVAQQLPWTGNADGSSVTFTALHKFAMQPQSGKVLADFQMEGTRKGFMFTKYAGRAAVDLDVMVDPNELAGLIRINKITELQLDNTPGLVSGIIKGLVNVKMKGKEMSFCWK